MPSTAVDRNAGNCSQRIPTDGFAEQNGRDASFCRGPIFRSYRKLLITCRNQMRSYLSSWTKLRLCQSSTQQAYRPCDTSSCK